MTWYNLYKYGIFTIALKWQFFISDPKTINSQLGKKKGLVSHFLALNIKNKSQFFANVCLTFINNTSVFNWSNIFHRVHIYNTLEGEEKVPLSNAPPFGVIEDRFRVKVSSTDCKSPRSSTVRFYTKKCKSIIDVTKPCVCVVMPLCWLYSMELCGPAQTSLFTGEGVKRIWKCQTLLRNATKRWSPSGT